MRVIKKKLKSRFGFSLAETLIAVLILLMVSAIVGAAIPAASNVYMKTVDAANAQLLLSTATNALREKLSTATSPLPLKEGDAQTIITFKTRMAVGTQDADAWCMIKMDMDGGTLKIYYGSQDAAHQAETSKYGITSYDLVSKEAKTENLSVIYTSVACNNGVVTFYGLQVTKDGVESPLAGPCDLSVRTFS